MPIFTFDTKNSSVLRKQETGGPILEPVEENQYNLYYAFLLIPRFESHTLSGDIVEYLYSWVQQICISYGWKLDNITVQPEYMQWVINVAVTASPSQILRLTRRLTSNKIFEEFPRYKKLNMGGDFWAPPYMLSVGRQLHMPKMIREFILATRRQQSAGSFEIPLDT